MVTLIGKRGLKHMLRMGPKRISKWTPPERRKRRRENMQAPTKRCTDLHPFKKIKIIF